MQEVLNDVLLGIDQAHGLVDNLSNAGQAGQDTQHVVNLNAALSSVMYIAPAPDCPKNRHYAALQRPARFDPPGYCPSVADVAGALGSGALGSGASA